MPTPTIWSRLGRPWAMVAVGLSVVVLLLLIQSHYRLVLVVGPSMSPGLRTGNLLVVDKRAYQHSLPQRGDVVLARYRKELIVKRVVGLPGEKVELRRGHLYVNDQLVPERHSIEPGPLDIRPGRLFPGKFALLGDNRGLAPSVFVHAIVPGNEIVGKVLLAL